MPDVSPIEAPLAAAANRWLLLVQQLPARPSNARVKTWRRLRQLGAISVKDSVYVLPNSAQAMEDFEWLKAGILSLGGQATIFFASSIQGIEEQHIVNQFQSARAKDFKQFQKDVRQLRRRTRSSRQDDETLKPMRSLRDRLADLQAIDFFCAPGGEEAQMEFNALESARRRAPVAGSTPNPKPDLDPRGYGHRTWVTRPRPGIDRFASAWLIRRFIDQDAAFVFAADAKQYPEAVPFDMYDVGFKHEGDMCTFEVLRARFEVADGTVQRLGEIVHDIDLKDERFKAPHAATVGALVDGLRSTFTDDAELLKQGMILIETLYRTLQAGKVPRAGRAKIC